MKLLLLASVALVGVLAAAASSASSSDLSSLLREPPRQNARKIPHPPHVRSMKAADFHMRPAAESKDDALKRAVKTIEDALDTSVNPCEVCGAPSSMRNARKRALCRIFALMRVENIRAHQLSPMFLSRRSQRKCWRFAKIQTMQVFLFAL